MVFLQRMMQYLFHGKTILSINKYTVLNLWDYYEWEAKKYGCGVNYNLKITNATDFSSSWNTLLHFYRWLFAYIHAK